MWKCWFQSLLTNYDVMKKNDKEMKSKTCGYLIRRMAKEWKHQMETRFTLNSPFNFLYLSSIVKDLVFSFLNSQNIFILYHFWPNFLRILIPFYFFHAQFSCWIFKSIFQFSYLLFSSESFNNISNRSRNFTPLNKFFKNFVDSGIRIPDARI